MPEDYENRLVEKIVDTVNARFNCETERYASSKYKEWSGILGETKKDIKEIKEVIIKLSSVVTSLEKVVDRIDKNQQNKILPKINTWDKAAANQDWGAKTALGLFLTTLVGLVITIIKFVL